MDCACYIQCEIEEKDYMGVREVFGSLQTCPSANEDESLGRIRKALYVYNIKMNHHTYTEGTLELSINPDDSPESFYESFFEVLENKGCRNIAVKEQSEYGERVLNYRNGNLVVIEDTPLETLEDDLGEVEEEEIVSLDESRFTDVLKVLKGKASQLASNISENTIFGMKISDTIGYLEELKYRSKSSNKPIKGYYGTTNYSICLYVSISNKKEYFTRSLIEFKKKSNVGFSEDEAKALASELHQAFSTFGLENFAKSSLGYFKDVYGAWEWTVGGYIVYCHVESSGGTTSPLEIRIGCSLPRHLEDIGTSYINREFIIDSMNRIFQEQLFIERKAFADSVEGLDPEVGKDKVMDMLKRLNRGRRLG